MSFSLFEYPFPSIDKTGIYYFKKIMGTVIICVLTNTFFLFVTVNINNIYCASS